MSADIDKPSSAGVKFLPYQQRWIEDESRLMLWEKSFRIGATWADAFRNVRRRLHFPKRDYLFATKDYASALEYMSACKEFCDLYNRARSIVAHGEEVITVPVMRDGKASGFTEEVKIGYIKFDNGSRIIAFSANPNAMVVYGGDVGMDEYPRHERAQALWTVAQSRATWGYDIACWGSHQGNTTLFYQFAREARVGKGGWSYHITTIVDAIADGLVEKINETRGTKFTREEFLEDCKKRAKLPGVFEESYMCNPQGDLANIVQWSVILGNLQNYAIARAHMGNKEIADVFGPFYKPTEVAREKKIGQWLEQIFGELRTPRRYRLGFDIAASGQGDLGCFYIDAKEGNQLRLRGLLSTRTEDWHFMESCCRWFMRNLPAIVGRGDETGLGRQICWNMAQEFGGNFVGVNFKTEKVNMGTLLMTGLSEHGKLMPSDEAHQDIPADFYALRKTTQAGKVIFHEGPNEFNEASHCDIAWAGGLASLADQGGGGPFQFSPVTKGDRGGRMAGL